MVEDAHRGRDHLGHVDQVGQDVVELLPVGVAHGGRPHFLRRGGPREEASATLGGGATASRAPGERAVNERRTLGDSWSRSSLTGHAGDDGGPYYRLVNPIGVALVALVVGLCIGALLVWIVLRRRRPDPSPALEPAEPVVPAGVAEVLAVLNSTGVVVGPHDEVLQATGTARTLGLVRGSRIVEPPAARPGPAVRRERRRRHHRAPADHRGRRAGQLLHRPGRPAGRGPDPGAGRRPDRRPPDRADPPGLRGQRQPRAEDPDRRHLAAGRGGGGSRRRPGGGAPVRQPDGGRVGPADRPGGPDHRPVPAAGRQPAGRPGGGRRRRGAQRGGGPAAGGRRAARRSR